MAETLQSYAVIEIVLITYNFHSNWLFPSVSCLWKSIFTLTFRLAEFLMSFLIQQVSLNKKQKNYNDRTWKNPCFDKGCLETNWLTWQQYLFQNIIYFVWINKCINFGPIWSIKSIKRYECFFQFCSITISHLWYH